MESIGTIVFSTVGRSHYGFDLFSVKLEPTSTLGPEHRLTDAVSINFNAQFVDDDQTIVFISERTGSPRIYLSRSAFPTPKPLPSVPTSLFHDRPIIRNDRLYFISAHEQPDRPFKSWSALYSSRVNELDLTRLTPYGTVDYSPAISQSGNFVAVASYGSRPWSGEFHELRTDIVVFPESEPNNRVTLCERGGWPTWSGDSVIYFHRQADDGWWSIFRVDFQENIDLSELSSIVTRVTPPGLHCFTPAAMHEGKRIAVATRRRDKKFRHIEIFDTESKTFCPVTETLNPNFHHYNPFVSPGSRFLGYHRFRGESTQRESTIPYIDPVMSPIKQLRMLRVNGSFPSFSPSGDLIVFNHDFDANSGVKIVRSDGSKRWTLLKGCTAFYNSWSPVEAHVIYTSLGPIFQSAKATVQLARIKFDPLELGSDREDIECDVQILTREETGNNAFPSCSPDGKSLVFRSGRSGHKNLYIVDAVQGEFGRDLRRLTDGQWIDTMPSWSPKGDLIAFSSNRHTPDKDDSFGIYVIKPDGSDLRRIHVAGSEGSVEVDRERINHVCFSRDGKWLLFTANLGGVTGEPVSWPNQFQPYGDLYVIRLDGSGLRRLTWNGYENGTPAWHSGEELDMGRLYLVSEVGDKLKGEFEEPLWISCDIEGF
ncbi:Protein TolB [Morella rubra]|uniref:Protein TolB n=1 Tax=Morella rubra TaxID=262757 RepID=A0A6A1UQY6_9ROSI|nr:Protein TolB [Morella rubra]